MRVLFLFLVLANVAFFAWARHIASAEPPRAGDAPAREVAPEKLKIVPPAGPQAGKPAERPAEKPAEKPAPPPASASPAAVASAGRCLEWGSFTLADFPRAEKALAPLGLGERVLPRRTEEVASWWVFIAPQGSRQAAQRKAAELKSLGVHDYFIVGEEHESRWALSLGVFRTEEAARARLAYLRRQGVRSAQIAERQTLVPKVWLQVKDADAALQARLAELAGDIEGSELRPCP